MAVLRAKTDDIEMILKPYRISEEGQPTWILTQLEFKQANVILVSTTFSMTKEDFAELRKRLSDMIVGQISQFSHTNTDCDFIFKAERLESPGDFAVGFWAGEQYVLMKGYRFVVVAEALKRFNDDLLMDEAAVAPPSRLP